MSVYTNVTTIELEAFLRRYEIGKLRDFTGIEAGIENTNYFVTTDRGRYVLTLFERTAAEALPFCLRLMAFLADHSIPSAQPIGCREGGYVQTFKGKPAALVLRLPGVSVADPDDAHCRVIGATIGRMHEVTQTYALARENERGLIWHERTAAMVRDRLDPADGAQLDIELDFRRTFDFSDLPHGVIHADLFRDNALFSGHSLAGLIDFYYAHTGPLLYDLAVTVADWCFDPHGRVDTAKARAMAGAYADQRTVTEIEVDAWLPCLRAAGLRFWLSRLRDQLFPRDGEITHIKDPGPFKAVVQACHAQQPELQSIWD